MPEDVKRKKKKMNHGYDNKYLLKQDAPISNAGMTADQTWGMVMLQGSIEKADAEYSEPVKDASLSCAGCVFSVRGPWDDPDRCDIVQGNVEWFGGCKHRIDVNKQAEFMFSLREVSKADAQAMALKLKLVPDVVDVVWDGSVVRSSMTIEKLKESALAFVGGDPESKSNYKLLYRDSSGSINANAVRAIRAALGGARGGVDLPISILDKVESSAAKLMDYVASKLQKADDAVFMNGAPASALDKLIAECCQSEIFKADIFKTEEKDERLAYGVVLSPEEVDSHNDYATMQDIEKACHNFNEHVRKSGVQHYDFDRKIAVVESYIAPVDFEKSDVTGVKQRIKKGSWILVTRVDDDETWDEIKKGKRTGYSFGGFGVRIDS